MSGAMSPPPLYALIAWTWTTLCQYLKWYSAFMHFLNPAISLPSDQMFSVLFYETL